MGNKTPKVKGIIGRLRRRLEGVNVASVVRDGRFREAALDELLPVELRQGLLALEERVRSAFPGESAASNVLSDVSDFIVASDSDVRSQLVVVMELLLLAEPEAFVETLPRIYEAIHRDEEVDFQRWLSEREPGLLGGLISNLEVGVAPLVKGQVVEQKLSDIRRSLSAYATAHARMPISIKEVNHQSASIDGEDIHLPRSISQFGDSRDEQIYWGLAAILAGYLEFGSYDFTYSGSNLETQSGDSVDVCHYSLFYGSFEHPLVAKTLFQVLELARITNQVHLSYPGVAKANVPVLTEVVSRLTVQPLPNEAYSRLLWCSIGGASEDPDREEDKGGWGDAVAALHVQGADVGASVKLVRDLYAEFEQIFLSGVSAQESSNSEPSRENLDLSSSKSVWKPERRLRAAMAADGINVPLTDIRRVRLGVLANGQNYREVNDFLERNPGHRGGLVDSTDRDEPAAESFLDKGEDVALVCGRGALYPEWDFRISGYKKSWVRVTEYEVVREDSGFVERVHLEKGEIIGQVRRKFEAIRDDEMIRERRVKDGDLIDIDAAVQARLDFKSTGYVDESIYSRLSKRENDLAVGFLVDLSSSTNEPAGFGERSILDVEKEALLVVCEAIEALGQESAVWGFSGSGREEVSFYIAKRFSDSWDSSAKEKIGGLSWKMENRDGAAIRHAVSLFSEHRAHTKLLVVLSDGRPLDCGSKEYRDDYGRADTRRALLEAKSASVNPYCITVDPSGANYLPELYGNVGYTVIENVTNLPELIPRIIRQLTR